MKTLPCAIIVLLLTIPGRQASAEENFARKPGPDKIETIAAIDNEKSRRVRFVDEDGDGINDVVQQRAWFQGSVRHEGDYQENQGLFMNGESGMNGKDGASGQKYSGKGFRK